MGWTHRQAIWTAAATPGPVVTLAEVKAHARVDHADEDALLTALAAAAVAHVEAATQRLLAARACTLRLPGLPTGRVAVELPGGVVQSLTSITVDGEAVDLTGCEVLGGGPALLLPAEDWPVVAGSGWPVSIAYVAGWPAGAESAWGANVPWALKVAALMIAAGLYDQRESQVTAAAIAANPAVAALLSSWRIVPR